LKANWFPTNVFAVACLKTCIAGLEIATVSLLRFNLEFKAIGKRYQIVYWFHSEYCWPTHFLDFFKRHDMSMFWDFNLGVSISLFWHQVIAKYSSHFRLVVLNCECKAFYKSYWSWLTLQLVIFQFSYRNFQQFIASFVAVCTHFLCVLVDN
jgi:hypothetical protein